MIRNAVRNVGTNWLAMGLSVVIALLMMPFVVRKLGSTGYGFWALLQSVISYMFVLDFGLRSGLNRHLARLHANEEHAEASRIASTGLYVYAVVGGAVVLSALCLGFWFNTLFHVETFDRSTVFWSVVLVGVGVSLRFPGAVFDSILSGVQRYDLTNSAQIAGVVVRSGLVLWTLESGFGVVGISAATLIGNVVTFVGQAALARVVWPDLHIRFGSARLTTLRLLASHSVFAYVLLTATQMITESGTVIVGTSLGTSAVAFYAIPASLIAYATSVISGISTTISPAASSLEARGQLAGVQELCLKGTRFILLTGLPILITYALSGDAFIRLWIGPGYDPSYGVLALLSLGWSFNYVQAAAACVVIGLSRHSIAALLVVVQAILAVGLGIGLVRGFGILGVAGGAAAASIVMNTLFQRHALRVLDVPVWRFLREGVAPALMACLPLSVALPMLMTSYPPTTLLGYFAEVALSVGATAVLSPWLALTRTEREMLSARARRLFGHASLVLRNAAGRP
jgi:O-antigen/teichoic acid export membrane protein